ncbi:MAG: M56 family metallopeptidase, partial [Bacteroidota bacterium]
MYTYLLQTSICWLVFYGIYWAFLRKQTFFELNRWFLLLGLLSGMVLPLVDWAAFLPAPQQELAAVYAQPLVQTLQLIEVRSSGATVPAPGQPINWLMLVYAAGVILSLGYTLVGLFKLGMLYQNAQRAYRVDYELVQTDQPHLPFSFFRALFLSNTISYSEEELARIIKHERAHIVGWHSVDVLLVNVVKAFFWFNPLVYLYRVAIRDTHEYIADRAVLKTVERKEYGQMLISQSLSGPPIALVNSFISSQLKKRILMMTQPTSSGKAVWRYFLVLPFVALFMMAFSSHSNLTSITIPFAEKTEVDEMPRFPGCEGKANMQEKTACALEKMVAFIGKELKYPTAAVAAKTQGIVFVRFTVEATGEITEIGIEKGIGSGCDEAALSIVEAMPNWIPGKKDGKSVATEMTLPIRFALPTTGAIVQGEEVFKVVEEMPRFPGCEEEDLKGSDRKECADKRMLEFIYTNIKYPKAAREAGMEGTVVAKFIVEKDGRLSSPEIVRAVGEPLSKEVLRMIYSMNEMEER